MRHHAPCLSPYGTTCRTSFCRHQWLECWPSSSLAPWMALVGNLIPTSRDSSQPLVFLDLANSAAAALKRKPRCAHPEFADGHQLHSPQFPYYSKVLYIDRGILSRWMGRARDRILTSESHAGCYGGSALASSAHYPKERNSPIRPCCSKYG